MSRDILLRIRIELPELRQQILRHVPPVRSYLALMESLVRGELARGFDKAKLCFVKSAKCVVKSVRGFDNENAAGERFHQGQ